MIDYTYSDEGGTVLHQGLNKEQQEAFQSEWYIRYGLPNGVIREETDADGNVLETLDRSELWQMQTPQGFHLPTIAEAYRRALADPRFARLAEETAEAADLLTFSHL